MKKAELSIQVVIIAAIALVVLVVLIYLAVNSGSKLNDGVKCANAGGLCKDNCGTVDTVGDAEAQASCGSKVCCNPIG